jgi:hypothetical protein
MHSLTVVSSDWSDLDRVVVAQLEPSETIEVLD